MATDAVCSPLRLFAYKTNVNGNSQGLGRSGMWPSEHSSHTDETHIQATQPWMPF